MSTDKSSLPKLIDTRKVSPLNMARSLQVTLIDGKQNLMEPLEIALQAEGYVTYRGFEIDEVLPHLPKTDIMLIDSTIAAHPKSSKLIKTPRMLVLTRKISDKLPPWLEARHVFLISYPKNPQDLSQRLSEYMAPPAPSFGAIPSDPEHLALLFGINQTLSGHFLNLGDLFERVLNLAPYLNADFAGLLIQESEETTYYRSTQPGREELTGPAGRRFAQRLINDGIEGWVLRHNQAVVMGNTLTDSRWFRASYLPDQTHCIVALPITLERVEGQGVYLIGHNQPGHFTTDDLPLLRAASTQIAMAIENAMLFKNQSERSIQLSLINEVGQAATSILNMDAMLRTVVQAIQRSFTFYDVSIHLYNPTTKKVELRASAASDHHNLTLSAPDPPVTHELRQGLIGWAMATNKTIVANDVTRDPRYIFGHNSREVRAELCVPVAMGVKAIGVLDLRSTQLEAFDHYHVSALETLGDQLAIAVENARLYDEINQRVRELQALNEIGQAITSTLDLKKTLKLITNETIRLMDVAAASVALRDDACQEVWFAAASGEGSEYTNKLRIPLGQGLAGWVAQNGEAVIVSDVSTDERFFAEVDKGSGFTTRSILCVPLQTKGRTIGAIEVMNKQCGAFNKEDQALLQSLAISAATAIENAQLYEEQAQTIKRLAQTQSQLVQSGKLAAMGELAAGVAHEINNPLTTIIALTSLLTDGAGSSESERYEDLQMIHKESRRARDIVRSLLDFARADTPKRQTVDLNQLIEEAIVLVYTQNISQKITLNKSLVTLPSLSLDANQIKQVIVNLLNNAIHAMLNIKDRATILTVKTEWADPSITASNSLEREAGPGSFSPENFVLCTISDTGHGIQPEHIDKIFDPFFTTKEVGQGTGLGLSISYGLVKQHGGDITVTSTPALGTSFALKLPVYPMTTSANP